jgi:uncharacterized coiled-coil protein SlyX
MTLEERIAALESRLAEIERHLFNEAWRNKIANQIRKEKA